MTFLLLLFLQTPDVKNELKPTKPLTISLARDLVLGGEEAEDHEIFSAVTKVAVNADGRIYVLDSGNFRIVIYDGNGKYLKMFGGLGPGPGEFKEPVAIICAPDGGPVIFDTGSHKTIWYDKDGNFKNEKRFSTGIHGVYNPVSLPGGHYAFTCFRLGENMQMSYQLTLLDGDMKELKSWHQLPLPKLEWSQAGNGPGFWVDFLRAQLEIPARGIPFSTAIGEELAIMTSKTYSGTMVNPTGVEQRRFSKKYKPRPLSDEAKEALCEPIWQGMVANPAIGAQLTPGVFRRALDKADALDVTPPVTALVSLGSGFGVLTAYDPVSRTGQLDVFDAVGKHLGTAAYTGTSAFLVGSGPHLFAVGPDEDDYMVVERFQVKGLP